MIESHFFKSEESLKKWGWIHMGEFIVSRPLPETEVRSAMKKINKPFEPGIGIIINKLV